MRADAPDHRRGDDPDAGALIPSSHPSLQEGIRTTFLESDNTEIDVRIPISEV